MDVDSSTRLIDERGRFAPASDDLPLPLPPPPAHLPVPSRATTPAPARRNRWLPEIVSGRDDSDKAAGKLGRKAREALALEIDRGVPFLLVPVFLAIGAMSYFSLSREPHLGVLVAIAAFLSVAAVATRSRPALFYAAAALALMATGMLAARVETLRAATVMLGGEIATTVTGRVERVEQMANGRLRLTMLVLATERPVLRHAPERIRVSARAVPPGLAAGSVASGLVRLQAPSGPPRPGSYDFSFESYQDGIGATGFFLRGPVAVVAGAQPRSLLDRALIRVETLRAAIAERIRARIGGPEGQIAAALIVGVRAGIPEPVNEAMRRAGLYHIISISGLHMALVAGVVMGVLRAALAMFPGFAARHPVKKFAALTAILAIAAYLFISGGEVAAERSFIMLAVMLAAALFDRAALTTRNLAISAVVVILLSPHEVIGPSFQMSFAATAALVGAFGFWTNRERRSTPPSPGGSLTTSLARRGASLTAALAMTSIIAGLATAAFGIYHFQRVSPLSLFANLAAMPVVSLVVMPCAVLASVAMPFGWDGPVLDVMGWGIATMTAIAQWFSDRSPVDAVGLIPGGSVICVTVALVIATMATTWLRVAALPFAVAALVSFPLAETPDIFVSEDASLVGVLTANATLAVNRDRPSAFSVQNWQRAMGAGTVLKPTKGRTPRKVDGSTEAPEDGAFRCEAGNCLATLASGATVLHTADAEIARNACSIAQVIVVADPAARVSCADRSVLVVSARQLALRGSAAIYLGKGSGGHSGLDSAHAATAPRILFSIGDDDGRPWHGQRRFSRAARGIAPYVPRQRKPIPSTPQMDSQSATEANVPDEAPAAPAPALAAGPGRATDPGLSTENPAQ